MRLPRLAWLTLGWNVAVILWGAFVRASGSGAGCGAHWPLCNGEIVPRAPAVATLVELTHRLTSGIALLLVFYLAYRVFRERPAGHPGRRAAASCVVFILSEAAVGAGLVLFRLVADNESVARALFMSVHLMNTFVLLACLTLTAHFTTADARPSLRGPAGLAVRGRSGRAAARRHERSDRGPGRYPLSRDVAARRHSRRAVVDGEPARPAAPRPPGAGARRAAAAAYAALPALRSAADTPAKRAAPGRGGPRGRAARRRARQRGAARARLAADRPPPAGRPRVDRPACCSRRAT